MENKQGTEHQTEWPANRTNEEIPKGTGYSFPLGIPLCIQPLLLVGIISGKGKWWGYSFHLVYIGFIVWALWLALSNKEYQKMHTKDPTLNRTTWVMNWLLFFVLLPLIVWVLLGLPVLVRSMKP